MFVNKSPDNSAAFQELSTNIRNGCTVEEFAAAVPRTNPSPAQIFQTLEIVLLSDIQREVKPQYLSVLSSYITRSLSRVPGADEPEPHLTGMMNAYRDAKGMIDFCGQHLTVILGNTRGTIEVSAEDINSYQFAKLQDRLRLMLRLKRVPFEERTPYSDPAPSALERTREDFLDGSGTLGETEVNKIIAALRSN